MEVDVLDDVDNIQITNEMVQRKRLSKISIAATSAMVRLETCRGRQTIAML